MRKKSLWKISLRNFLANWVVAEYWLLKSAIQQTAAGPTKVKNTDTYLVFHKIYDFMEN